MHKYSQRSRGKKKEQISVEPRYTLLVAACLCLAEVGITFWVIHRVACECAEGEGRRGRETEPPVKTGTHIRNSNLDP